MRGHHDRNLLPRWAFQSLKAIAFVSNHPVQHPILHEAICLQLHLLGTHGYAISSLVLHDTAHVTIHLQRLLPCRYACIAPSAAFHIEMEHRVTLVTRE